MLPVWEGGPNPAGGWGERGGMVEKCMLFPLYGLPLEILHAEFGWYSYLYPTGVIPKERTMQ
ncbi:MAG TPA: hypothetical protein PKA06_10540, partial [Gemmatales bacterium]|nr:hypothetical protein [Gemmatales bacterium]